MVKIPRWAFEKFPEADQTLDHADEVGGRGDGHRAAPSRRRCRRRCARSSRTAGGSRSTGRSPISSELRAAAPHPELPERLLRHRRRLPRAGSSTAEIHGLSHIDPWFLENIREIVAFEAEIAARRGSRDVAVLRRAKQLGFADRRIADADRRAPRLRSARSARAPASRHVYKTVDTCAAEFVAPHALSLLDLRGGGRGAGHRPRRRWSSSARGPNRIGQGIEFDYCCVHAAFALREAGVEAIMVNCNPETVSTDYDTSDRLYFEPLTLEDVLNIVERERPLRRDRPVRRPDAAQAGGAAARRPACPILGTPPDAIDRAEDRQPLRRAHRRARARARRPAPPPARSSEARAIAGTIGYPVLVRPSYVLGGRAMQIVHDEQDLRELHDARRCGSRPEHPILVDKFLEDAIEIDVDAIARRRAGGGRRGDGAHREGGRPLGRLRLRAAALLARRRPDRAHRRPRPARWPGELGVVGLLNIQFAIKDEQVYVLEVNPRASRTVPFVSKAIGVPLAKLATRVMLGRDAGRARLRRGARGARTSR